MIEVFKTNVRWESDAAKIVANLTQKWNNAKINFDMEDCDKILRIEGTNKIKNQYILSYLRQLGYNCEVLE